MSEAVTFCRSHGCLVPCFACDEDDDSALKTADERIAAVASPAGRQKRKNDGRLMLMSLVGLGALEAIARGGEVGLVKYRLDGYREDGGYSIRQCLDSAVRHIYARGGGEKYDADATELRGKPVDHLDLAIWNLAAACENLRVYGDAVDDCWKGPKR